MARIIYVTTANQLGRRAYAGFVYVVDTAQAINATKYAPTAPEKREYVRFA